MFQKQTVIILYQKNFKKLKFKTKMKSNRNIKIDTNNHYKDNQRVNT